MSKRFTQLLIVLTLFASVWMHGGVVLASDGHDMGSMSESCLEHCLGMLKVGQFDDAIVGSVCGCAPTPNVSEEAEVFYKEIFLALEVWNYKDVSWILTTQKLE
jgi:hypothetical protein